jgi:DNA polymerase-3 subunit delta
MKLEPRRTEAFLRDPGSTRVVLLYGDDVGLIRERAVRLAGAVAGASDDPFRVVEFDRDGVGAIPEEMAALSLTGGRRVVRVRDAGDGAVGPVQVALAGLGEALLVLEAPGLPTRSKLRGLIDKLANAVSIGCYPAEGRALEQTIRDVLSSLRVGVEEDALAWLTGQLGADRAVTVSEVEKLALFVGPGGRVDIAAARECVGDLAGLSLEDALFAATAGEAGAADRALELAVAEGAVAVQVARAGLMHVQRLQRARAAMAEGASVGDAARAVRPPLFFRRQQAFMQALTLWTPTALEWAALRFWEAERLCKRTGTPGETIAGNAVAGVAQRAAAARRR